MNARRLSLEAINFSGDNWVIALQTSGQTSSWQSLNVKLLSYRTYHRAKQLLRITENSCCRCRAIRPVPYCEDRWRDHRA